MGVPLAIIHFESFIAGFSLLAIIQLLGYPHDYGNCHVTMLGFSLDLPYVGKGRSSNGKLVGSQIGDTIGKSRLLFGHT